MLELSHIQYMVGEKRVLQNVSARFPAGHITGIIGPNGAGKTSLLRVAAGLAQVSAGTVMAQGDFADAGWRAKNIAYMPQFQSVAWPLSVREVVALGLLPLHLGASESEKRVDSALQRCGMARFAARRIDTLSGGEKARVYLARFWQMPRRLCCLTSRCNRSMRPVRCPSCTYCGPRRQREKR